jgi:hypothetical protein
VIYQLTPLFYLRALSSILEAQVLSCLIVYSLILVPSILTVKVAVDVHEEGGERVVGRAGEAGDGAAAVHLRGGCSNNFQNETFIKWYG